MPSQSNLPQNPSRKFPASEPEPLTLHRAIIPTLERYQEDKTVKPAVKFTFPPEPVKEPIICSLGQQCKVVTNIRRADVNGDKGWVVLGSEGERKDIERGIARATGKGVRVDSVMGDIVEG